MFRLVDDESRRDSIAAESARPLYFGPMSNATVKVAHVWGTGLSDKPAYTRKGYRPERLQAKKQGGEPTFRANAGIRKKVI